MAIPRILLLLGSFDPVTKQLLYRIREHVAKRVPGDIYALILDELELFEARDPSGKHVSIALELGDEPAAMVVKDGVLQDYIPLSPPGDVERLVAQLEQHGYTVIRKLRVLEKLENLARSSDAIILVRHREETRCGEYIELTFLLDRGLEKDRQRIYMLWRSGLPLSGMLKELIIEYGFTSMDYGDEHQLLWLVEEIASRASRA